MKKKILSKVDNLNFLRNKINLATIPDFKDYYINKNNIKIVSSKIIKYIRNNKKYIIRSSAADEDQKNSSKAGYFDSFLVENKDNVEKIQVKLEQIFKKFNSKLKNKIFVQEYIDKSKISGVLFSKDPSDGSNYYIINYSKGSKTDVITSGKKGEISTIYVSHYCKDIKKDWVRKLINISKQLESIFSIDNLDIEFAISGNNKISLLQVRPLVIKKKKVNDIETQKKILKNIQDKIKKSFFNHPYLYGKKNLLGVMPDWNPAEIIGIKPKALARSLYEELITDGTWAYQRDNYGYKNLRSFHLMDSLGPTPYIDIRICFNSFLPKDLDDKISNKLVNFYLNKLSKFPHYHDKVEFEIVYSCLTFDFEKNKHELKKIFNEKEISKIKQSLKNLTNNIINGKNGYWIKDLKKIKELEKRQKTIINSKITLKQKIYWLIEDCKRFGTLPFAGLARVGFISVQILNSLRDKNLINEEQYVNFMQSVNTEAKEMNKYYTNNSLKTFLFKYGHLRPGTYDITSPRYDEKPNIYFDKKNRNQKIKNQKEFILPYKQLKKIQLESKKIGFDYDPISLFSFIKQSIEYREKLKFIFTKSLSDALSLIKILGKKYSFNSEEMAHLDYKFLKNNLFSDNLKERIKNNINLNKKIYKDNLFVKLPYLISAPKDAYYFEIDSSVPNFITTQKISGVTIEDLSIKNSLQNKIVFIKNADPGYDWLFTHKIAGLITEYGGVNSHMAIRANEIGLPSVIGAGKTLFDKWKKYKKLEIDCKNKKVTKLM